MFQVMVFPAIGQNNQFLNNTVVSVELLTSRLAVLNVNGQQNGIRIASWIDFEFTFSDKGIEGYIQGIQINVPVEDMLYTIQLV